MRMAALWMLFLLLCAAGIARAQPAPAGQPAAPRIGVVTMGPGDIFWERFGHDAIVVDDPAQPERAEGLDARLLELGEIARAVEDPVARASRPCRKASDIAQVDRAGNLRVRHAGPPVRGGTG